MITVQERPTFKELFSKLDTFLNDFEENVQSNEIWNNSPNEQPENSYMNASEITAMLDEEHYQQDRV
jgi:hypothetical protein